LGIPVPEWKTTLGPEKSVIVMWKFGQNPIFR